MTEEIENGRDPLSKCYLNVIFMSLKNTIEVCLPQIYHIWLGLNTYMYAAYIQYAAYDNIIMICSIIC